MGWGRRGGIEVEVARAAVTFHGVSASEGWEGIKNHIISSLIPRLLYQRLGETRLIVYRHVPEETIIYRHNTCVPVGSGIAVKRISGS